MLFNNNMDSVSILTQYKYLHFQSVLTLKPICPAQVPLPYLGWFGGRCMLAPWRSFPQKTDTKLLHSAPRGYVNLGRKPQIKRPSFASLSGGMFR